MLTALLDPKSIAVVGASPRENTAGCDAFRQIIDFGYTGEVYPINPKYSQIFGRKCYPSLDDIVGLPEHVVICVANQNIESEIDKVIACGAKAATIFASAYISNDTNPTLPERIGRKLRENGIALCGANSMGFLNLEKRVAVSWFPFENRASGSIATICHSGAILSCLLNQDPRLRFNLAVSSGQELTTTVADYMKYALSLRTTKVVALFLETIRDVPGFIEAAATAREKGVPIVALKIGKTSLSARLAESHSGAIAGNHAAYGALFAKSGIIEVETIDELAATALLLSSPKDMADGDLGAVLDSGGARGHLIDVAEAVGVNFAAISQPTANRLTGHLAPGLDAVNPLDAWGTATDFIENYTQCLLAISEDAAVGLTVLVCDVPMEDYISEGFVEACIAANSRTEKPICVATNFARLPRTRLADKLSEAGIPLFDGAENALRAIRNVMAWRKWRARAVAMEIPSKAVEGMDPDLRRLIQSDTMTESDCLDVLDAYGIPTAARIPSDSAATAVAAAERIGYPVVLKTAAIGVLHKSDVGGVKLNLRSAAEVYAAYEDVAFRLGPKVLVCEMIKTDGVEVALGIVNDDQVGPLLIVSAGGVMIELLEDSASLLCPVSEREFTDALAGLKIYRLLSGFRGKPTCDLTALARVAVGLSRLAIDASDIVSEVDINPIIVSEGSCVALDALIRKRTQR
ncbi:acetate--CoA ligase family protein [Mesorhizobium mediterraneum]|uniref:acetate--CoA ligase family protein n=1 Tax=Mesorhizobium mediterraneum TaxID=43617 RepID=UPI00178579ED